GTYAVAAVLAVTLFYKTFPLIRSDNDDTLARYAKSTVESLPKNGGILLNDNETAAANPQIRALLIQAELARTGRARDFLIVDTQLIDWAPYSHFLHEKAPDKWPAIPGDQTMAKLKDFGVLSVLNHVAQSNTICYLNPSYGYFFEMFYQEPHGLVYRMKMLPADTLMPPPLSTNLVAENQAFWKQVVDREFPRVEKEASLPDPAKHMNPARWLIMHLHGQSSPNPNALLVANLYSRSLDDWGVQLQRDGHLAAAAGCFASAKKINPANVVAALNLDFNQKLQSGAPVTIDPSSVSREQFGKYSDWNAVLNANGPFDDPSFLFVNSALVARSGLMRQTVAPFTRLRQLVPDFLPARLWLAQIYLYNRQPDRALDALQAPLDQPERFGLNETNSVAVNTLAAYAHLQKNDLSRGVELLNHELAIHPADTNLLASAAQAFFARGLYTNALRVIDHALAQNPDSPQWLFGKGIASLQMSNYDQAISAMTHLLNVVTNDPNARFNRGVAYLQTDQLDKARADLSELQTTYTNSPQIAFRLGEVAEKQHDTNEAIRNYEIFLANVPTNSPDIKTVNERIARLQKK
ncbi:MAG TPA: tetratricopeptide repeat protein, partial [Candidatus Binatia bacterium]|nr:tetratricopeptide repeat protein [Candidatus Binatia bacterium]